MPPVCVGAQTPPATPPPPPPPYGLSIGFDAANAKRLFKVGQRFHAQQSFEGNGMGLVMAAVIMAPVDFSALPGPVVIDLSLTTAQTAGGKTFTVTQSASSCTFTVSPASVSMSLRKIG